MKNNFIFALITFLYATSLLPTQNDRLIEQNQENQNHTISATEAQRIIADQLSTEKNDTTSSSTLSSIYDRLSNTISAVGDYVEAHHQEVTNLLLTLLATTIITSWYMNGRYQTCAHRCNSINDRATKIVDYLVPSITNMRRALAR